MSRAVEGHPQFDGHAADYEEKLMQGLSLSGESPAYFATGRVTFLREWWTREGRPEPLRILDYGCGVGLATALLARQFPKARVLGLDPSRKSIERAAGQWEDHRIRFEALTDATDEEPADLVHLNGVVHHVPPEDRPRLFDDVASRLAPGGVVALFENNPLNPGARWVMARIPFDRDAVPLYAREARDRLRAAGLVPIWRTVYLFYFPRFLRVLRPFERLLCHLPLGAQYGVLAEAA
jgi:SAM-dependent methyltransferase